MSDTIKPPPRPDTKLNPVSIHGNLPLVEVSPNPRFDLRTWVFLNVMRDALLLVLGALEDYLDRPRTKERRVR